MTTQTLQQRTSRYLYGRPMPAEVKQLQNWLSCTGTKQVLPEEEKERIEQEILAEIQAYTAYPLFYPRQEPWWKKMVELWG